MRRRIGEADPRWLSRLEKDMPQWLCCLEIRLLSLLTAGAFAQKAPSMRGRGAQERLGIYRGYTVRLLQNRTEEECIALRERMYRRAYAAGRLLARLPGMRGNAAKRRLIILLYRGIGIALEGELPGSFRVPSCFFSERYTPENCHVMSGMDAGIICGIFGGGSLAFCRRLTEGCSECRAVFDRQQGNGSETGGT